MIYGFIAFLLIFITLLGIEVQLKKNHKQNERIAELLEEIKENQRY
ncbi:hypothetical protein [Fictibacillus sp. BK138]|nr:hypothetical protein [Fictibacillus sp. BK138]RZT23702.1 hypothetical protein EV282_2797 [Fictibacillus sp. BK138]